MPVRALEEPDAARRMPGRVDHFKGAISEIDDVAGSQDAVRRRRQDPVTSALPALRQPVEHLIGRIAVGQGGFIARIGEDVRLGPMHAAVGELVMAADVIEVGVARDADDRPSR